MTALAEVIVSRKNNAQSLTYRTPSFRRRPESSGSIQNAFKVLSPRCEGIFFDWIPACAGMTDSEVY